MHLDKLELFVFYMMAWDFKDFLENSKKNVHASYTKRVIFY